MRATLLASLIAVAGGCKQAELGAVAKNEFSHAYACPVERVEARTRPEILPSAFLPIEQPPPEVADDPTRMKVWQADHDQARTAADARDKVIEARGCDHQSLYVCHEGQSQRGVVRYCKPREYRAGMTKW